MSTKAGDGPEQVRHHRDVAGAPGGVGVDRSHRVRRRAALARQQGPWWDSRLGQRPLAHRAPTTAGRSRLDCPAGARRELAVHRVVRRGGRNACGTGRAGGSASVVVRLLDHLSALVQLPDGYETVGQLPDGPSVSIHGTPPFLHEPTAANRSVLEKVLEADGGEAGITDGRWLGWCLGTTADDAWRFLVSGGQPVRHGRVAPAELRGGDASVRHAGPWPCGSPRPRRRC